MPGFALRCQGFRGGFRKKTRAMVPMDGR